MRLSPNGLSVKTLLLYGGISLAIGATSKKIVESFGENHESGGNAETIHKPESRGNDEKPYNASTELTNPIVLVDSTENINGTPNNPIIDSLLRKYPSSSGQLDKVLHDLDSMIAQGLVGQQYGDTIHSVISSGNPELIAGAIEDTIGEVQNNGEHHEGNYTLIMILSLLATAWFGVMIVGAAQGKPISFVKHHAVFAALTLIMGTQMPHEIMHGLLESLAAYLAIFGIVRASRGIRNTVDFENLNADDTKAALRLLGPIASVITTPAAAGIFSPMRKNLNEDEQYVAMQTVGNMDGAIGIGDFPFIYNFMKNGAAHGLVWQLGVMGPIMIFHKIYQGLLRKITPKKLAAARPQIWEIIKGFRFDKKRLGASASIAAEEMAQAKEFLSYLKGKIATIESLSEEEKKMLYAATTNEEHELSISIDGLENVNSAEDVENLEKFTYELESMLTHPDTAKDIAVIVGETQRALANGYISQEELEQFMHGSHDEHNLAAITKKIGISRLISKREGKVDGLFNRLMHKVHANHNEVEISRVFTAQALAISLLIPSFNALLGSAPDLLEAADAGFSCVADNYAATAVTWLADSSKAIAFAIIGGALSIYGNMANLNFMGKEGNFQRSLAMSKYILPTLMFAYGWFNSDKIINMMGVDNKSEKEIKKTSQAPGRQLVYGETNEQYERLYGKTTK